MSEVAFFFLDVPPYRFSTASSRLPYEMYVFNHVDLINVLSPGRLIPRQIPNSGHCHSGSHGGGHGYGYDHAVPPHIHMSF